MNTISELYHSVKEKVDTVIIGKDDAKAILFSAFLAGGNVLLEGVPGVAKTLMARAFAKALGLKFSRIQFTPDLMPTDVTGTSIYHQGKGMFEFIPGPIFSDFILSDEINRAPAKTQAALLEAMEERQISVDSTTHQLSDMFIVFATQNPVEFEGTYPLPEAQLDRFMVKLCFDYPSDAEELEILSQLEGKNGSSLEQITPLDDTCRQILQCRSELKNVVIDETITLYVRDLIRATRNLDQLVLGNSPRAGKMLLQLARAYAAVTGSSYVTPDHIRELVPVVLPHRWVLRPSVEIESASMESIVASLFDMVEVPK